VLVIFDDDGDDGLAVFVLLKRGTDLEYKASSQRNPFITGFMAEKLNISRSVPQKDTQEIISS
jgi:hypothetical protein